MNEFLDKLSIIIMTSIIIVAWILVFRLCLYILLGL